MKSEREYWVNQTLEELRNSKVVIIEGLRRIGKSLIQETIMESKHYEDYVRIYIKIGVFGQDDEKNVNEIFQVMKNNKDNKYVLFMDEFQDYPNWAKLFFTLYDFPNTKVLATGSISSMVDGVRNTEGGRFRYISMPPLSFKEFTLINKLDYSEDTFHKYATMGSYPGQEYTTTLVKYKEQVSENIIEKIKNQKYLETFRIESAQSVSAVLLYIVENIGQSISINSMSEKLNIKNEVIEKIINYLKQTFIIHEVGNSYQSKGKAAVNNRKYYLTDHTFYLYVRQLPFDKIEDKYQDFIFENIIINNLRSSFQRKEIEVRFEIDLKNKIDFDLVILKDDKKHYFEIKNSPYGELSDNQSEVIKQIKGSVIYKGKTELRKGIQYINYLEFIQEPRRWM